MYIAITYIGGMYVPGEVVSEDMPKERLEWLIRAGAVRKAAPAPAATDAEQPGDEMSEEDSREMTRENYRRQLEGLGNGPDGMALVHDGPADEAPAEWPQEAVEGDAEDEIDVDAEAPEIDVMAGIVKDTADPEEPKPARKPRATSKKAPKGGKTR